jgi:hypothetical protein
MKKTFFSRIPVLSFVITGFLLFGLNTGYAQETFASADVLHSEPKGNFVTPADAVTLLDADMNSLKSQMAGLPHSSLQYKLLNWRYIYYEHLISLLAEDKTGAPNTTAQAIGRGIRILDSDIYQEITYQQKLQIKQHAIDLLKA